MLGTTEGMTSLQVTTEAADQTDLAKYYITGPDTYFREPNTWQMICTVMQNLQPKINLKKNQAANAPFIRHMN